MTALLAKTAEISLNFQIAFDKLAGTALLLQCASKPTTQRLPSIGQFL